MERRGATSALLLLPLKKQKQTMAPQTSISTEPAVFWTLMNLCCEHHTKHRDLSQMCFMCCFGPCRKDSSDLRPAEMEQRRVEGQVSEKWSLLWFSLMRQEKDNEDMFTLFLPPPVFQVIQTFTHTKLITLSPPSFLLILSNLDKLFEQVSLLKLSIFWKVFSAPL